MSDIRSNFKQDTSIPLIDIFNNSLEMTLNEHAPLISLLITEIINNHWYNHTCANSKIPFRKLERTMCVVHTVSIKLQLIFIISLPEELIIVCYTPSNQIIIRTVLKIVITT